MELYEKVRPKDWDGVVGQDRAVRLIRGVIDRNGGTPGGKAFWLAGPTGMGKTTIAKIIASKNRTGARFHQQPDHHARGQRSGRGL